MPLKNAIIPHFFCSKSCISQKKSVILHAKNYKNNEKNILFCQYAARSATDNQYDIVQEAQ